MITYDHIEVSFGDFVALPDIELTINEGEFFTLLGPSGCGKTTALRTLAGFIQPSGGRVIVAGKDVTRLSPAARDIGMVFQNYALFPSMTVRANIGFGLAVKRLAKAEINQRVDEIAAEVGLSDAQLSKSVAELSGGQQQRVAIARALVTKPKILLLDEPLSNLDAKLRHRLRGQLKELQAQFGITTVYVTHDQEEALTMSDRIAVMNLGRIEQVGTPLEVYHRSATEFVCTFIGDVNALPDDIRDQVAPASGNAAAYLRIERPELVPAHGSVRGIAIAGRILARSFHGLYTSYQVEIPQGTMKIASAGNRDEVFEEGDLVQIGIDPADVLSYEPRS